MWDWMAAFPRARTRFLLRRILPISHPPWKDRRTLAPGDPQPIIVDVVNKQIELGQNLTGHYGSVWYKGDSDIASCIDGKCLLGRGIRAYFEFTFDDTDDLRREQGFRRRVQFFSCQRRQLHGW